LFLDRLEQPLHKRKPCKIFVGSVADLFSPSVPFEFIDKVRLIATMCPQHTFQILTKRPEVALKYDQQQSGYWPKNVWLGTTCENQEMWNERWRYVSAMPSVIKYVSHEPLLSQIEPVGDMLPDWAIIGCESLGKRAGRFQDGFVEAAIKLASFYKSLYVPVFVKQVSINGKVSKNMSEWPKELQVREYPKASPERR